MTISLILLSITDASAQWSGGIKADGSWNFERSNAENADLKFKYTGQKFYVGANVNYGHSFLPSNQTTSILDAKREQNEYYKGEDKDKNPRRTKAGGALDFGYTFNPYNVLKASLGYGFGETEENSNLETERYNGFDKSVLTGTQIDSTFTKKHSYDGTITYNHKFVSRPDARLDIILNSTTGLNMDVNHRLTSGSFYPRPKNYATYSSLNDFDSKLSASYDDCFRFEKSRLKLKAGLDLVTAQDLDGYAAETFIDGQWRDSTAYRQSYYYYSFAVEPYVNLTYNVGKFDFFLNERGQIYNHALLDKLDEKKQLDNIEYLFDTSDFENLLNAGVTYRINDRHHLTAAYGRSISRPDYKKLCPTLMIGGSEGEYILGNPSLLPETVDKINFSYTYTRGIFVTKLDVNYRDKKNTAEKVIDLEKAKEITEPGVKTIKTWINNKRQNSFGLKLDLRMNGNEVKADIWAGFNYDTYWKSAQVDKSDFNYELGTAVDVFLNETSKLSSSLAYVSAKQSAFNLKGEDVIANLRFSKFLTKGLEIYVELKNIVDKEIYEETWNADMNYLKIVSTKPMRRAALLGINYVF